jgi:heme exporter protein D
MRDFFKEFWNLLDVEPRLWLGYVITFIICVVIIINLIINFFSQRKNKKQQTINKNGNML